MKPIDAVQLLENAGADRDAAEGSQAHALAMLSAAIENLVTEASRCCGGTGDLADLRIAVQRLEV